MTTNSPQEDNSLSSEKAYSEPISLVEKPGMKVDDSVLAWAKKVGRGKGTGSPSTPAQEYPPSRHSLNVN